MTNIITFHKIQTNKKNAFGRVNNSVMWQMTHIRVTKVKAAGHTCQLSPIWNKMNIQNHHTRRGQNGQWRHIRIRRRAAGEHPPQCSKISWNPLSIFFDLKRHKSMHCHHGVNPANRKKSAMKTCEKISIQVNRVFNECKSIE